MDTAWSHLPNAKYIDMVLDHVKANPEKWCAARDEVGIDALDTAWGAVQEAARDSAWGAAQNEALDAAAQAAWGAAWGAAQDAIAALIVWDHCGSMLELTPNKIRVLAALGAAPAILLESAVIALNGNG